MNSKSLLPGLLIAICSAANAQSISFGRTYKVGDKDVYQVSVVRSGKAAMALAFTETLSVTKSLEDGGAEVSVAIGDLKMNRDGQDIPLPAAAASALAGANSVQLYSKQGFPYQAKGGSPLTGGLPVFGQTIFANGLTVGQDVPFDNGGKEGSSHTKGTITATDVTGNIAHIHVVADTTNAKGDASSHVDGVYTYDTSTGKLTKFDFKVHSEARGGSDTEITMTLQ